MRRLAIVALGVLLCAPLARADEDPDPFRDHPPFPEEPKPREEGDLPPPAPLPTPAKIRDALEEELKGDDAPDPALVEAEAGIVLWPFLRTRVRISRENGLRGTSVIAEEKLGLPERAVSPWVDATVGGSLRFGLTAIDLFRDGGYSQVSETFVAAGRTLADPGDHVATSLRFTQADAYVRWDVLRGPKYRIGILGGARLTHLVTRIEAIRLDPIVLDHLQVSDYVWSPFFGGHLEFAPVPIFAFYANVRFIDWSWGRIGLQEQRTYEMRLGMRASLIPDLLTLGMEFRFLSAFLDPRDLNGGRNFSQYQLDAGGLAFVLGFTY